MIDLELLADTMEEWSTTSGDHHMRAAAAIRQLIKLQASLQHSGEPVAAIKGWFHGECVIQALDPAAVLPAGMALYAAPQLVVPDKKRPCQIEMDEEIPSYLLDAFRKAFSHYGLEIKEFDCVEDDDVCCGNYQSCTGAKLILSEQESTTPQPVVPEGYRVERGSVTYNEILVTAPDGGQQTFWPDDAAYELIKALLTAGKENRNG